MSLFTLTSVTAMKADRLMLAAKTILGGALPSDDYLLAKLKAAEADASRRLRTKFEPTTIFAYQPTAEEITALGVGALWDEESAYDYEPALWSNEDWGYLVLRQSPVISIESVTFAYPAPFTNIFTVPSAWLRIDKKAGHVRFVPTGATIQAGMMSSFVLSAMSGGRDIPQMVQVRYVAGLQDAENKWPDLVDLIYRMAVLRIVHDSFVPQSASISADGLSQSMSVQIDAYSTAIENDLNALIQAIHGIRMAVL